MRDIIIIFVLCVVAIVIGGWMYFGMPDQPFVPGNPTAVVDGGIKTPVPTVPEVSAPQPKEVAFTVLARGDHSTVEERKNLFISDAAEFEKIWKQIHPEDPLPDVNFATESVIALFAGQKSSGGYTIAVEKIVDFKDTETVSILLTEPGAECLVTQALTTPFELIKLPASGLIPKSEERTAIIPCS